MTGAAAGGNRRNIFTVALLNCRSVVSVVMGGRVRGSGFGDIIFIRHSEDKRDDKRPQQQACIHNNAISCTPRREEAYCAFFGHACVAYTIRFSDTWGSTSKMKRGLRAKKRSSARTASVPPRTSILVTTAAGRRSFSAGGARLRCRSRCGGPYLSILSSYSSTAVWLVLSCLAFLVPLF